MAGDVKGDMIQPITVERGRIKITLQAVPVGNDICVILYGGDTPHIGCVTLSVPRPGLKDKTATSATTSVLNVIGHKDDEAARYVSCALASKLNKNVVVTCGIHVEDITEEEIGITIELLKDLTNQFIQHLV